MPAGETVIELKGVSFTYPGAGERALSDVDLTVGCGEMVVVMGATGAGKTTLAKCLNRTIPGFQEGRLEGEVALFGRSMTTEGVGELAGQVALVSQDFEAQLFATNAVQEVAFGMEQLGVERAEMLRRIPAALRLVGLEGFDERDPVTLSGGEKQRLAIAAVLALEPRVLVFDEPTTDLDPLGKEQIFDVLANLRRERYTIVLVEHEIAAAERADRLVLMQEGRIVADGPPRVVLPNLELLESVGVRPADLDRIGRALGWKERPDSLDGACALAAPRLGAARVDPECPPATGEVLLAANDVRHLYEDRSRAALDGVSLEIRAGEFIALIGQNGSGKTTLAKHLNGLLRPSSGRVLLRGQDVQGLPLDRVAADVGYVFQNPDHQIFADTVGEEVSFALRNFGVDAAEMARRSETALGAVGLVGMEAEDPFLLGKGQRQRLAVASLLALQPRVLILDEPTTGLDYREQRRMMDLLCKLHRGGMTLIVITHSPWVVAEYAERGVLISGGRIRFDGPLRRLFAEEALLADCHFRIPEVTRLSLRCGFTALTVDELLGARAGGAGLER
jgi:energy-coupling factor transport system ATP-binding protein